jgi:hypothetical protein
MKMLNYCCFLLFTILFPFSRMTAQNLVNNGDFEQGNGVGFRSDYIFIQPIGSTSAGQYGIGKNPQVYNSSTFISMGDHTTGSGNMMIVDGTNNSGNPEPYFWRINNNSEICGLQVGVKYTFSYWIKSIYNASIPNATVAHIGIKWNNVQGQSGAGFFSPVSGSVFAPNPGADWQKVSYEFIPTNPCVRIEMFNLNANFAGNDFAIDDIELLPPVDPLTLSFSSNNFSCSDTYDGFIAVYGKGGVKPYAYFLTGDTTINNATGFFQNLPPGNYNMSVRDANDTETTLVAVTLTQTAGALTISGVPAGPICPGQSVTLTASGATEGASYTWTAPPSTTPLSSNASLNVIVTQTTTFKVRSSDSIPISGKNLTYNGDFSQGDFGFQTDYQFAVSNPSGKQRTYGIQTNPQNWFNAFAPCPDKTTGNGNMMVIDGSTIVNDKVWCQKVPVKAGETYTFAYHVQSLVGRTVNKPSSNLEVQINGVRLINPQLAPAVACIWEPRTYTWNSGTNTVADICILNRELNGNGNDFAIDDISFISTANTATCTPSATLQIVTAPLPSFTQPTYQTVTHNDVYSGTFFEFNPAGTTIDWTNSNTSIGLLASGSGNINPFKAINTGSAPVVATITATPINGNCVGESKSFTITVLPLSTGVTNSILQSNLLKAYPNPVRDVLLISYATPTGSSGELRLLDMQGRIVISKSVGIAAGENRYELNLSNTGISAGSYVLKLQNGHTEQQVKVVVVR